MPELFRLPQLPKYRGEIPLYRTPRPKVDLKMAPAFSRAFGIDGTAVDAGSRIVVKSKSGILEIFEASGSVWWTKASAAKSESMRSIRFPDDKQAIALADEYLKKTNLSDASAKPVSVTYSEVLYEKDGDTRPKRVVVGQHVNYAFTLDGIPVWGPGAKIQVTFGANNEVVEALKFWRPPSRDRMPVKVLEPGSAVKVFQTHDAFAELKAETASVQIEDVSLGLYALPPREMQGYLIPVYRVRGMVSTKQVEKYEFTKHVVAVEFTPEMIKKAGAVATGGGPVF